VLGVYVGYVNVNPEFPELAIGVPDSVPEIGPKAASLPYTKTEPNLVNPYPYPNVTEE
jgi:hypothetical protein